MNRFVIRICLGLILFALCVLLLAVVSTTPLPDSPLDVVANVHKVVRGSARLSAEDIDRGLGTAAIICSVVLFLAVQARNIMRAGVLAAPDHYDEVECHACTPDAKGMTLERDAGMLSFYQTLLSLIWPIMLLVAIFTVLAQREIAGIGYVVLLATVVYLLWDISGFTIQRGAERESTRRTWETGNQRRSVIAKLAVAPVANQGSPASGSSVSDRRDRISAGYRKSRSCYCIEYLLIPLVIALFVSLSGLITEPKLMLILGTAFMVYLVIVWGDLHLSAPTTSDRNLVWPKWLLWVGSSLALISWALGAVLVAGMGGLGTMVSVIMIVPLGTLVLLGQQGYGPFRSIRESAYFLLKPDRDWKGGHKAAKADFSKVTIQGVTRDALGKPKGFWTEMSRVTVFQPPNEFAGEGPLIRCRFWDEAIGCWRCIHGSSMVDEMPVIPGAHDFTEAAQVCKSDRCGIAFLNLRSTMQKIWLPVGTLVHVTILNNDFVWKESCWKNKEFDSSAVERTKLFVTLAGDSLSLSLNLTKKPTKRRFWQPWR